MITTATITTTTITTTITIVLICYCYCFVGLVLLSLLLLLLFTLGCKLQCCLLDHFSFLLQCFENKCMCKALYMKANTDIASALYIIAVSAFVNCTVDDVIRVGLPAATSKSITIGIKASKSISNNDCRQSHSTRINSSCLKVEDLDGEITHPAIPESLLKVSC